MHIAVVVAGGAVETLQTGPLLDSLQPLAPDGVLLACAPAGADLARGLHGVGEVAALRALAAGGGAGHTLAAALRLRSSRLDAVVVCSSRPGDRVAAYLAGIARRVGEGGGRSAALLTGSVTRAPGESRAAAWARAASLLGGATGGTLQTYEPGEEARRRAEATLLGGGFEDGRILVGLAPGSGWCEEADGVPAFMLGWEPERFAHLANHLARRHGAGVVLLGAESDRDAADRFMIDADSSVLDLVGTLAPMDVAAVAARCDLVVAPDSLLLHLAAAVGTPVVGLFGPTSARSRAPLGPSVRVVQGQPDEEDRRAIRLRVPRQPAPSMRRIRVDDVLAAVEAEVPLAH